MPPKKSISELNPKELVLAKMPRYPQWPAFIMPDDLIPKAVLRAKKKATNFCVIFIPDGDFYWMTEKALEPLTAEKLEQHLEKVPAIFRKNPKKKKNGKQSNINEAFAATYRLDFDTFIGNIFNEDNEDDEEDEDEEEEEDEENGIKQEVTRPSRHRIRVRKSPTGEVKDEIDDNDDIENDEDLEVPPKKKRVVSNTNKRTPNKESTPTAEPVKSKHDAKPLTPEEKQHQLWLCRIKLQRSLIQRNQPTTPKDTSGLLPPTADELLVARLILYRLVEFPVNVDLLKKTKIHKVLKCILKDEALSYPDSFKLHERCSELLAKWDTMIQSLKVEKAEHSEGNGIKNGHTQNSSKSQDDLEMLAINISLVNKKDDEDEAIGAESESPLEKANVTVTTSV
jgi:hypothetical protein